VIGLTVVAFVYGARRPVGTALSWGEAMAAAVYVFLIIFLIYGVVPHQWLAWADSELGWRPDKIGIPAGPLGALFGSTDNTFFSDELNVFFPEGIPLANGHFVINSQAIRDVIAAGIYIVALGVQIALWAVWQNRGKKKPAEIETSAFGRPLVKAGGTS
jgi:hypothetical protein